MGRYLMGVDSGTTGVKAKIYDTTGNLQAEAYREYSCRYPQPGWVEQDVALLTDAFFDTIAEAVDRGRRVGVDPSEIAAFGLSAQRCTHMYLDKAGRVLRDGWALSWQDSRNTEECAWMRTFEQRYFRITGLPVGVAWGAGKIKWMMTHEPEVIERTAKIVTFHEYLLHALGAEGYYQDWATASQFGLFDITGFCHSDELLSQWGLSKDLLPELVGSGWQIGTLSREAADRTGLPQGMPLCSGGGDQMCAGIGAGVLKEGQVEVTFGTSGVALAALASPTFDPNRLVCLSAHALPEPAWESEGLQNAAASCYRWFRDNLAGMVKLVEPFTNTDPYEILNAHAAKAPVGSHGVIFAPYLAGSACPNFNASARGAFLGLSFASDFGSLARAVMEGVSFEARTVIESFGSFLDIQEIRLSGGATKSRLWNQIQADVYGRPTASLREGECSVLGAAILAGHGAGLFSSMSETVEHLVNTVETYEPIPENVRAYDDLFALFKSSYQALADAGFYDGIAAFQRAYQ